MKEYSFGTWYPIEDLSHNYKDVLLLTKHDIEIGYRTTRDRHAEPQFLIKDGEHGLIPISWMPLPPRPEGEGEE